MKTETPELAMIELSQQELTTKQINSRHLQAALEALHRDGICVLKNAIDPLHLDKLNSRMIPDAKILYDRQETHHNFGNGTGNIQQEPPIAEPYIFEDVIANPFAASIIECMVGPRPCLRFYSANTLFKAEKRQPVHVDVHFDYPNIPFGFCVNINLVDVSPENGSTELWLGSHLEKNWDCPEASVIPEKQLEERRKINPPIQPTLPKGSLIIRDFRLWHAGRPNRTDNIRVMLVAILFAPW